MGVGSRGGYFPPARPVCRHCTAEIYAAPETFHGIGWIHVLTNRERCPGGTIAEPPYA